MGLSNPHTKSTTTNKLWLVSGHALHTFCCSALHLTLNDKIFKLESRNYSMTTWHLFIQIMKSTKTLNSLSNSVLLKLFLYGDKDFSDDVNKGKTHVMVGIKAELGEPLNSQPDSAVLEFFVDCSANASPVFEGRGGDILASELSSCLAQMINGTSFDLKSLCIVPGKHVWVLYVDAIVLEYGGNLLDTLVLAVKAALKDTLIPELVISGDSDDLDIDVSDDQYDVQSLDITNIPVTVTVNKIGDRFVLDATSAEEACSDSRLVVAVNGSGKICGLQKFGHGGLNPELTFEMIEVAKDAGKILNQTLMNTLNKEVQMR